MSLPLSPSLSLPENERAKVSLIIVAGGAAGGQLPACLPACLVVLWQLWSFVRLSNSKRHDTNNNVLKETGRLFLGQREKQSLCGLG